MHPEQLIKRLDEPSIELGLAIVENPKSIRDIISMMGFLADIGCLHSLQTPFK